MPKQDLDQGRITASHEVIYPRYDPEVFVGRQWLVERIAQFRDDNDGRILILVGEPGFGKSAFVAYLAETWNCPRHFVRVGSADGVTGVDPRAFLLSIGTQLFQKYGGEIFEVGEQRETKVTVGLAKDQVEIVGRLIEELHTPLPFLRQANKIEVKVGAALGSSQVIGERVKRLVNNALSLPETTLLHIAVIQPLQKLQELYPDEKVVILVDALDESSNHPGPKILDVIPRPSDADFPSNLRLVMTTRPGDHLAPFRIQDVIRLDDESAGYELENLKDVRAYIDRRLGGVPLADAIAAMSEPDAKVFVTSVIEKSEGNFLYLYHFFNAATDAIKQGEGGLNQIKIPTGLDGIYRFFAVERIKGQVELRDWVEIYLPIMGTLAVIREPVTREQLAGFAGVAVDYVDFITAKLLQFLDVVTEQKENRFRFYHSSFSDYLTDASRNRDYPLAAGIYHARIVDYYRGKGKQWSEVDWSVADPYCLHNLTAHLDFLAAQPGYQGGLIEAYISLLSQDWLQSWHRHTGTYVGFLHDVDAVLEQLIAADRQAIVQGLPAPYIGKEVLCILCHASVNTLSYNLPAELLIALRKYGCWTDEQVLAYARKRPDASARSEALRELAPYLSLERQPEVYEEAFIAAQNLRDESARAMSLRALAPFQPDAVYQAAQNLHEENLATVLCALAPYKSDAVYQATQNLHYERCQVQVLISLVSHLPEAIYKAAQAVKEDGYRSTLMLALAPHLPETERDGALQQALQAAQAVKEDGYRSTLLLWLAPHLPETERDGALQQALQAAQAVKEGRYQSELMIALAPYLPDVVYQVAQSVEDGGLKTELLIALAPHLPDTERESALHQALQAAQAVEEARYRSSLLLWLAPYLPEGEQATAFQLALQAAQAVTIEGYRIELFLELAPYQPNAVYQATRNLRNGRSQALILSKLVDYVAESERAATIQMAVRVAQAIQDEEAQTVILSFLYHHLPDAEQLEALQLEQQAARGIGDDVTRELVLYRLAPSQFEEEEEPSEELQLVLQMTQDLRDEWARIVGFGEQADPSVVLPRHSLYAIWTNIVPNLKRIDRAKEWQVIVELFPTLCAFGGNTYPSQLLQVIKKVRSWWP